MTTLYNKYLAETTCPPGVILDQLHTLTYIEKRKENVDVSKKYYYKVIKYIHL